MSYKRDDPVMIDRKIPGVVMEERTNAIHPDRREYRVKFLRSKLDHFTRAGARSCLWAFWFAEDRLVLRQRLDDEEVFLGSPVAEGDTLEGKMAAAREEARKSRT